MNAPALLVTGAVVALLGCTPAQQEGHFSCAEDGLCPADWVCRDDGLCWRTATTTLDYRLCTQNSACGTNFCDRGPMSTVVVGQCSRACATHDICPPRQGVRSTCGISGTCVGGCSDISPCEGDFVCFGHRFVDGVPIGACALPEDIFSYASDCDLSDGFPCDEDRRCVAPPGLDVGICALPCGQGLSCPMEEQCTTLANGESHCLVICGPDPSICGSPLECRSLVSGGSALCVAPGLE